MAKAGRGWPEFTKTPALAGIITQPELKTLALAGIQNPARLAGIESAKIRPWPGIHSASCKYLELNLQHQKLWPWPGYKTRPVLLLFMSEQLLLFIGQVGRN